MQTRTPLIAVTLLGLFFAGCSKHSPTVAASNPQAIDLTSLTNDLKKVTSEPVIQLEMLASNGKTTNFMVVTGPASQPQHYFANWHHSQWHIQRMVK